MLTGFTNAQFTNTESYSKNEGVKNTTSTLKLLYYPPELVNMFSNEKIDVWCIGVLAYLMISGDYPFILSEQYMNTLNYETFKK